MAEQEYWAIIELMGHVRMAGRVSEVERFGQKMGRIDIPGLHPAIFRTVYFGGGSVYRESPVTEEMARAVAAASPIAPVHPWDLERGQQMLLTAAGEQGPPVDEDGRPL
jgi:hypothetical protein